ncbi:MAG: hypothetical protein D6696_06595 [Acidobacteria bacterium]|nr:MAG: hypothetical protein D6696_06595 [Acidobacteriota bacterium]
MDERPKSHRLDAPRNVARLVYALAVACALLLVVDVFSPKHPHLPYEGWEGFFAFAGFFAYLGIVASAKLWRKLVMRPPDYYGDDDDG